MASRFSFSGWSTTRIAPNKAFAGTSKAPTFSGSDTRQKDVAVRTSTFSNPNVPAYLNQAISDLNSEQSLKRSLQQEWQDRLFRMASSDSPDAYLWQEALRAASVAPGTSVTFGSAIDNPELARAKVGQAKAISEESVSRKRVLDEPMMQQRQLSDLEKRRAQLGQTVFGGYSGSAQQGLDNEISNLQLRILNPAGLPSSRSSGWSPSLPFI